MMPALLAITTLVGNSATPAPRLFGTVYESTTNTPVADATVTLNNADGTKIGSATADKDGYYAVNFKPSDIGLEVAVTVDTPGFFAFHASMVLSPGWNNHDFYIKPKMICALGTEVSIDIDCMTQQKAVATAKRFGSPFLNSWNTKALELLSEEHNADGEQRLLVLDIDGIPLGVARPILLQSAQSFSVNEDETNLLEVYRYKANIEPIAPLLNATNALNGSSSISTSGCPGGHWEQTQVYGTQDNMFGCTYWSNRDACMSCCTSGEAECVGAVVALGAVCGATAGWTGIFGVACAVATAAALGGCYYADRQCNRDCRGRMDCCIDAGGTMLFDSLEVAAVNASTARWKAQQAIEGRIRIDPCTGDSSIYAVYEGQNVSTWIDNVNRFNKQNITYVAHGSHVKAYGINDPQTDIYMLTDLVTTKLVIIPSENTCEPTPHTGPRVHRN